MSDTAVLVVDVLNAYEHPDADLLIPNVEPTIEPLSTVLKHAHETDEVDVVYVNVVIRRMRWRTSTPTSGRPPCT